MNAARRKLQLNFMLRMKRGSPDLSSAAIVQNIVGYATKYKGKSLKENTVRGWIKRVCMVNAVVYKKYAP